ncbi:hypothetical protein [Methanobrevibacter sp.]|uniref:hypothetical protein n=1 Tax=Methanobrevibacter sp. TaxID=66852 RepID=UPI00386A07B8
MEDEEFINFCKEKNLAPSTSTKKYKNHLKNYTNFNKMTLRELIDEADEEEENQIRMKRRKIRKRLIDFRTWMLIDRKFAGSTIKGNITSVKSFYRHHGIETPSLPNVVLNDSPNDHIEFGDLPTIDTIRTAMESTKKQNHKALILFSACTGSGRKELANFTFQQFLDGVAPFCHNPKNAEDVINELDGKCEELEIIPVFKMKRFKTDYIYYTPVTPECLQVMINYLKSEGRGLKPEDRFFKLGEWGVSSVFEQTNDKFNWGKRGSIRFFSSHRVRKFHASAIEDTDFANYIQGRKPGVIKETYFKKDVNRVREEYKKHMHKFSIYVHYDVMLNSEAYTQLKDQIEDERLQHANEVAELKNQVADERQKRQEEQQKHQNEINNLKSSVDDMQKQMDENMVLSMGASRKTKNDIERAINRYCKENLNEKDTRKSYVIRKFALDFILKNKSDFKDNDDYFASVIKKVRAKIALSGQSTDELFNQIMDEDGANSQVNKDINDAINNIMKFMTSNAELMAIIDDEDYYGMQDAIETHLRQNQYDLTNLTDADIQQIVNDVLMEYL